MSQGLSTGPDPSRAIQPALSATREILFKPIEPGIWLILGFLTFLQRIGQGSPPFNYPFLFRDLPWDDVEIHPLFEGWDFSDFSLLLVILIIALSIFTLIVWLSSRASFVYLENVITRKFGIVDSWKRNATLANSYFFLRLIIYGVLLICGFAVVAFLYYQTPMLRHTIHIDFDDIPGLFALSMLWVVLFFVIMLVFIAFLTLIVDFVVPIQYFRNISSFSALKESIHLITQYPGAFFLYFLFRFLFYAGFQVLITLSLVLTCCLAACIFMVPVLGQTLLQPYYLFIRLFPVYFLEQLGIPDTASVETRDQDESSLTERD